MTAHPPGARPAWRVLLWPGLATAAALAILLSLGAWQVQRLAWKTAWIEQLRAGELAPPEALPARIDDPASLAFRRFSVSGSFAHDKAVVVGIAEQNRRIGAYLATPLLRPGAAPLWVVRGWVPYPPLPPVPEPAGEVTVTGFLMLPERRGWFTPDDRPAERRFWAVQPAVMAEAVGLAPPAPFALAALGAGSEPPVPQRRPPMPRNDHLGYAITWFGLAAALAVFFVFWARSLLAQARGADTGGTEDR
jgi:surfeit locus 1 family protein